MKRLYVFYVYMITTSSLSSLSVIRISQFFSLKSRSLSMASTLSKITSSSSSLSLSSSLQTLEPWSLSAENTWFTYLKSEPKEKSLNKAQFIPREVKNAHFSCVQTESVPSPYFIAGSESCVKDIGLSPQEINNPLFVSVFSGNQLLPGFNQPYSTVYGCHSYGQWFGQLGDGRAMGLGEVSVKKSINNQVIEERYELQLKGCGRSPYSRGFDGRAVLRSSVREYLVSEAMYHLGVPTTRALSIIGTGQKIQRAWYPDTTASRQEEISSTGNDPNPSSSSTTTTTAMRTKKYPPYRQIIEPGAIVCRVARSFLRLTHLEIFSKRNELKELMSMTDFVCLREYPHLLDIKINHNHTSNNNDNDDNVNTSSNIHEENDSSNPSNTVKIAVGPPERYVELYRLVTKNNAYLVAEWLRVGYIQGNMNSDNTCLAGRTIDYGPYGWMEKYDPFYQPFTSDPNGNFAFIRQPTAMAVNIAVLAETFVTIVNQACKLTNVPDAERGKYREEITMIAETEYRKYFFEAFNEVRRKKLGFLIFDMEKDSTLWSELENLLTSSGCDYTIFFRELIHAASENSSEDALLALESAFYDTNQMIKFRTEWISWLDKYLGRIKNENIPLKTRIEQQTKVNPKFVLRNWMSILAYERATEGDYSIIHELQEVLQYPYDEQSPEITEKWYRKTPYWAQDMPGSTFMSCSS